MANIAGYTANTFTAGEQPTTTVWNELWSNDAAFNSFLTGPNITSPIIATGTMAKVFVQRTANASSGSPGTTPVAYNGFTGTYNFTATAGKVYQIALHEPLAQVATAGNQSGTFTFLINGAMVGGGTTSNFNATNMSMGIDISTYWQPSASGACGLTVEFATNGGNSATWNFYVNANEFATLTVNEFS